MGYYKMKGQKLDYCPSSSPFSFANFRQSVTDDTPRISAARVRLPSQASSTLRMCSASISRKLRREFDGRCLRMRLLRVQARGQMGLTDRLARRGENHGPLDDITQLADVARPIVAGQGREHLGGEIERRLFQFVGVERRESGEPAL